MKTHFWLSFLIILFFCTQNSFAQCVNGTKSMPLYKTGGELVQDLDDKGMEIVRIEYDLIFSSKESYRKLYPDWEYIIVAFSDEGVKDLDIKVYEYDGIQDKYVLADMDTGDANYAMVKVTPKAETTYKVEITITEFEEGFTAARYGLIYVHE